MRHLLLLLLLLPLAPAHLQAQTSSPQQAPPAAEVSLEQSSADSKQKTPGRYLWAGISANNYRGDLEDGLAHFGPALHLGVKFNSARRLNGSFALGFGTVSGQDPDFRPEVEPPVKPNNYFNSTFFTFDFSLHYHLIKKERFHLYISQGIGLFRYNPLDEQDQELLEQSTTRPADEIYGNISLQLPTALGVTYFLPNQWGLGLQGSYINPLTDYVDNIGSLGAKKGNDNILQLRLMILVPLTGSQKRE